VAYFLSMAGLSPYKDASRFEAFSCPWPPSSTFYKLREIERQGLYLTQYRRWLDMCEILRDEVCLTDGVSLLQSN
jgi:hypothetical protein